MNRGAVIGVILIVMAIITSGMMLYSIIQPPEYTKNYLYFQDYPVAVHLEVEESLSVEGANFALKTALISLNRTFNYNLSVISVSTFKDNIDRYSDDDLDLCLWSNSTAIKNSIENGRISFYVKFFEGIGPNRTYNGNTTRAAGISNYMNHIGIFLSSPSIEFNLNLYSTCMTIQHEFGHAFGLPHNLESAMMYSPEVDPEGEGPPDHPSYSHIVREVEDVYYLVNATSYAEVESLFLDASTLNRVCYCIDNIDNFTFAEPLNISESIPFMDSRSYVDYYAWYENDDLSNVSGVSLEAKYYFNSSSIYVTVDFNCCYFNVDSFSNYWANEEIQNII